MAAAEQRIPPTPRRRRRRYILGIVVLLAVLAGGAYAVSQRPWEKRPQKVAVEVLKPGPATQVLAVNGRVAAARSVTISATVSAQVLNVAADEGDRVEAGQVLAVLDSARAKSLVDQADAALKAGVARQQQAQTEVDRALALGDNTPRKTLVDAELALAAVSNEVAQLEAALEEAQSQLSQYTITAPMAGTVLIRKVEPGQVADPQVALFTLADLSDLVVETDVDELYSAHVTVGLDALLRAAGETVSRAGTVSFTSPRVDPSTGGRAIRIAFDDKVDLPVGLTVAANVIVSETPSALTVPRGALLAEGAGSRVYVIENGIVAERQVSIQDWPAERIIVTEGLAEGDSVILDPRTVQPGAAVVPAN